jgi:hypothetical protein
MAAACAKPEGPTFGASGSSGDNSGGAAGSGSGPGLVVGSSGNGNGNVSLGSSGGSGLPPVVGGQISAAGGPNITVNGQPKSVQLTATANGSPVSGTWTTSNSEIGTVDSSGVFHPNGYVGGTVVVSLVIGMRSISITLTIDVDITDNPAMASASDQAGLQAGGAADPAFKFLYPYDGTVFPRGLQTPLLQFGDGMTVGGGAADLVYLKLTTKHFSYQQYAAGGTPVRITIPDAVWNGATLSASATDAVTAAVSKRTGTTVSGPLTENWHIAPASLRGFIYYSTYKSPLLPFDMTTATGGGILRIKPGSNAEVVLKGCVVCHSVSANGSVLSAAMGPDLSNPMSSEAVNLAVASPTPSTRSPTGMGQQFAFAALSPDGTMALTNGNPGLGPPDLPHGFDGSYNSTLVDTMTGMQINSPSLTQLVHWAQTPAFSPDGKHVVFIDGDMAPTTRPLSLMDFDGKSVFSNLRVLRNETEMTTNAFNTSTGWVPSPPPPADPTNFPPPGQARPKTIAWPSFTPDSNAVIYHLGDSFDSAGFNLSGGDEEAPPQYAELRLIETDGTVKTLNALNGRDANGLSVLPYGEAVDNNMNYEPNVMPLPVGGYFWVVFTSRRTYGNTVAPGRAATTQPGDVPAQDPWGSETAPSPRKKLWIAAVDINHADAMDTDPSYPAFYLSGQEPESANMRAFAALAPCLPNGSTCQTGSDCCNGYCRQNGNDEGGAPLLQCVAPPMNTCSNVDEPCMTAANCCDTTNLCIGGRCAVPQPNIPR